ncbi:MAG: hypothetical protein AAF648_04920 [Pseudomonadota bacterium]
MLATPVRAADAPFNLAQQVAAEVASVLCNDPGYLQCLAGDPDRCLLELGLAAPICIADLGDDRASEDSIALTRAITQCLIEEQARLADVELDTVAECLARRNP